MSTFGHIPNNCYIFEENFHGTLKAKLDTIQKYYFYYNNMEKDFYFDSQKTANTFNFTYKKSWVLENVKYST